MPELKDWMLIDEANLLAKSFRFKDFKETMEFVNKVADIAEEEGHHPDLTVSYGASHGRAHDACNRRPFRK